MQYDVANSPRTGVRSRSYGASNSRGTSFSARFGARLGASLGAAKSRYDLILLDGGPVFGAPGIYALGRHSIGDPAGEAPEKSVSIVSS